MTHTVCQNLRCREGLDSKSQPCRKQLESGVDHDGLCRSCWRRVDNALEALVEQYIELYFRLEPGSAAGAGTRVSGSRSPSPVRDYAQHLMEETVKLLEEWDGLLRDYRGLHPLGTPTTGDDGHRRAGDGRLIDNATTAELRGREGFALTRTVARLRGHLEYLTGANPAAGDFVTEILDLRGRLIGYLGMFRGKTRLADVACPSCGLCTLVLRNGSEDVDCENPRCQKELDPELWTEYLADRMTRRSS